VRRPVGFQPLLGVDLVGADDGADVIVQDFSGGSRERLETRALQADQVLGQRDA